MSSAEHPPAGAAAPAGGLHEFRGRVTYKNGRPPEDFVAGPAVVAAWELYAARNGLPLRGDGAPMMLMALVVAFEATGAGPDGFETWRAGVYGVELDAVPIPPTPPVASAG